MLSTDTLKADLHGQSTYDPEKSSSSQKIKNCTWSIIYGDFSSCSGICYTDTFTLGDIVIPGMTIESAQDASTTLTSFSLMSGLVGLAWPSLAMTIPAQPVLLDFLPEVLRQPVFTTDLKHNSTDGSINFGYIDDSLHGSTVDYVDVDTSEGFWEVLLTSFSYQGSPLQYQFKAPKTVVVDTGTTVAYVPQEAVDTYHQQIPGAYFSWDEYGYVLPCNASAPDFDWEIGDENKGSILGIIPGSYLVYTPLDDLPGLCYSGLQSLGGLSNLAGILGDMWLKSGFQVWNFGDNPQFGYAPKMLGPNTPSTSSDVLHAKYRQKKIIQI